MNVVKLVSLNVRGLRGAKRHTIFQWLSQNNFDIVLLQETYCTQSFIKTFDKNWHGKVFHSVSDSEHSKGVCIMFKKDLNFKLISQHNCYQGRLLVLNIELNGVGYSIANIYAPNNVQERIAFYTHVRAQIDVNVLYNNLLLGGDFNSVTASYDRKTKKLDGTSNHLKNLMHDLQVCDMWRIKNEANTELTYIDPALTQRNSRIDLWLASSSLQSVTKSCTIQQSPAPDHKAVSLEIEMPAKYRGKGYWKLNATVLEDPIYVQNITDLIEKTIPEYQNVLTSSELWEFIKLLIKEHTIKYCVEKSFRKKDDILELEKHLDKLDEQLKTSKSAVLVNERKTVKLKLDQLYKEKSKGYQIRSRARWVEQGESSTAYFCGLEKSRQHNNCINGLKDETGTTRTSDEEILHIAHNFYSNLYSARQASDEKVEDYFENITPEKTLSGIEKDSCEGAISYDECILALSKMAKNKSPGRDGICTEFYQKNVARNWGINSQCI